MPSPKRSAYKRKPVSSATVALTKNQLLIESKEATCDACGHTWTLRGSRPSRCPACDSKSMVHLVHASAELRGKAS